MLTLMIFGFEPRHIQEIGEHIEAGCPCHGGKFGGHRRNIFGDGDGLLAGWPIGGWGSRLFHRFSHRRLDRPGGPRSGARS